MAENYKILAQKSAANIVIQDGRFVVVAHVNSNRAAHSTDGITWTASTLPASANWSSVTYGAGRFVATSGNQYYGGASTVAAWSTNATTWTLSTLPASAGWQSVTYGGDRFFAVAYNSSSAAFSTNGTTWTASTLPVSASWRSIAHGGGRFVVVSNSTTAVSSTNGITWTQSTLPPAFGQFYRVVYGGDRFLAIGGGGGSAKNFAAHSTDGITWTQSTLPVSLNWNALAYGNGRFLAIDGNANPSNVAVHSTDAITWAQSVMPASRMWSAATFGNDRFVVVAYNSNRAAHSTDGITWTESTLPSSSIWFAATFGGNPTAVANTQYTTPASTQTSISSISLINSDVVSRTYSVGIVRAANSGIAGITATQTIIPTRTVEPGVVDEIVGGITLSAGDQIRTNSDSTDLTVHIYGVEIS